MQVDRDSFNPKHSHADPCVNMDAHSNPRRALKSAQEQKIGDGAETKETELMCCRDSGTKEWKIEKVEGEGAFTAIERQVTSQQRSTRERERIAAETPEERERLQWMSTNKHESLAVETP